MPSPASSLTWEGIALRDVVARTGTPVLLASERRIRENIRELAAGLASAWPRVTLRYCAKTNPELRILRIVREEGLEVLASHPAEVRLALEAGFAREAIAYQQPVLDGLDAAIDLGVRRAHAFRPTDLEQLGGGDLRISLRVAVPRAGLPLLGAASARLGFAPDELANIEPRPAIDALNTYIGTQQEDPAAFRPAIRTLVRQAMELRRRGFAIEELNLGGGVPSRSLRRLTVGRLLRMRAKTPPLRAYGEALGRMFAEETGGRIEPRLVLEPGRSIVGDAVVLLAGVRAAQGRWRFLDCGRNVLVESPLAFSRWVEPLDRRDGASARIDLSGPTLNTLDVIDTGRMLPPIVTGDVLAFGDAGAYTVSRSTRYAGLTPAVWLAREDGTLECIRRAETFDDFTAPMVRA